MKKIGGIFAFKVKDGPGGKEATWVVDVKNGKGSVLPNSGQCSDDFIYRSTDKFTKKNGGQLWCSPKGLALELQDLVKELGRASLVAQWLRICLPMQGTRVRALVWEDPTCRGATEPVSHNY